MWPSLARDFATVNGGAAAAYRRRDAARNCRTKSAYGGLAYGLFFGMKRQPRRSPFVNGVE